jgi:putative FmdB family regulatory protein
VPIYEYQCTTCTHRFEQKQSIKDDPIKDCPRCGKDVTKLISSPAIMFKGSGWYITDYSDKMKPGAGSESAEKPTADSSDKTKAPAASDTAGSPPVAASTSAPAAPASTTSSASSSASTPSTGSPSSSSSSAA